MTLKKKYSLFLLLILVLLALFICGFVFLFTDGQYVLAILLTAILYGSLFLIGKRISIIFLQLSLLSHLKKNNGNCDSETCTNFLKKKYKKKADETEFRILEKSVLKGLEQHGLITIHDEHIEVNYSN